MRSEVLTVLFINLEQNKTNMTMCVRGTVKPLKPGSRLNEGLHSQAT